MSEKYRRLTIKRFPQSGEAKSEEENFWKKFRFPILIKQHTAITSIDFSPVLPYDFVVTNSLCAQIFSSTTNEVQKTLNRFKGTAYSVKYRSDGQLLVAGGEECVIRVFDVNTKSVLRHFNQAHKKPIHVTRFSQNNTHILSGADDCYLSCWDIVSQAKVTSIEAHKDHIRCGIISPTSEHIWVSGSYDHTVKIWDMRSNQCVSTLMHEDPVEDVLMLPSGGILISASGNKIRVWDILGSFNCLETISNHQKTITGLAYDHTRSRLFASSLESNVKIYDINSYKLAHTIKCSAPVLSVAVSPNSTSLVAGMNNGMLAIYHRIVKLKDRSLNHKIEVDKITHQYLMRGTTLEASNRDIKINWSKKQRLAPYDKYLKKFQYKKALDAALESSPLVAVSMIEEFIKRHALNVPLSGRNEVTLQPILLFTLRNITNPRYMSVLLHVLQTILDLYKSTIGKSNITDRIYIKLGKKLKSEIKLQKQLFNLQGIFDSLFATQTIYTMIKKNVSNTKQPSNTMFLENVRRREILGNDIL
ncbi:U3 small nucleolar RNA-associated protein 15 homolog [Schistocerca gregaria]|uniref:U3 small nucleolar RNA-associated protein 15 homolog n=1 Tax=Schistocerca gregaria TaxID=7010 RepID=UPI00211E8B38|nr:U3 small nucleolar RNA-associated protein 15 homolog [Schistocerca gregaria]